MILYFILFDLAQKDLHVDMSEIGHVKLIHVLLL